MLTKILIANRGEIACTVGATARRRDCVFRSRGIGVSECQSVGYVRPIPKKEGSSRS
jgi:hypothetical protein